LEDRERVLLSTLLQELKTIFQRTKLPAEEYKNFLPEVFQDAWDLASSGRQFPEEQTEIKLERLAPVVNEVYLQKTPDDLGSQKVALNPKDYRYPLRPLSTEGRDVMPVFEGMSPEQIQQEYRQLWAQFVAEAEQLRGERSFEAYFFTLFFLLKKYCSRVPSSAANDISVFDHSRVVTALADCLYRYQQDQEKHVPTPGPWQEGNITKQEGNITGKEFLLIEGGVSGIQNFIFNMVSPQQERARLAKRLRGRSFYVLLLTETIADYLLKELNLTIASQLWCSGGHFAILAPNTQEMHDKFAQCYVDINTFLLKKFHGDLAVAIARVTVSGEQFNANLNLVRHELVNLLEREKLRKFHNVLDAETMVQFPSFPSAEGGDHYDFYVDQINREQEQIGQRLTRLNDGDGRLVKKYKLPSETWQDEPLVVFDIGKDYQIAWDINPDEYTQADTVYLINNPTEKFWGSGDLKYGFKFLATHVDTYNQLEAEHCNAERDRQKDWSLQNRVNPGEIKGFADLAQAGSGGFLGVLRMDVDYLGAVFRIGIAPEKQSLARIAALSADTDLFFTGYFQQLCRSHFRKNIYIAYSGGDDLFVVGDWDDVLKLACRVRKDFKQFTCDNPDMNISGGLFLCKGKYPINRAAEQAKDLLELAKDNPASAENPQGKNAFALFKHCLPWQDFFVLRETADQLVNAIKQQDLNRAILYKILDLHNTWNTCRQLNVARLYYLTIRTIQKRYCHDLIIGQHQYLAHSSYIPMLVSYAALKTREKEQGGEKYE
jgi:CRISPR-associated protein Csm1